MERVLEKWCRVVTCCAAVAVAAALAGCSGSESEYGADLGNAETLRDVMIGSAGGGGGGGPAGPEPTGFADITGRFVIQGTPPPRSPVSADKDLQVCAPGGTAPLDNNLLVDGSGGIANVLFYLSNRNFPVEDPKWVHPDYAATANDLLVGDQAFDQKDCIFITRVFAMRSTQSVEILNSDRVSHNTKIDPQQGAIPLNETIPELEKIIYAPGGASPFPYSVSCSIHGWMKAWMISRDDPYFDVSNVDGSFAIPKVPSGVELEFTIWHELPGGLDSVTINGESVSLSRGRYRIQLEPDEVRDLEIVIEASVFE